MRDTSFTSHTSFKACTRLKGQIPEVLRAQRMQQASHGGPHAGHHARWLKQESAHLQSSDPSPINHDHLRQPGVMLAAPVGSYRAAPQRLQRRTTLLSRKGTSLVSRAMPACTAPPALRLVFGDHVQQSHCTMPTAATLCLQPAILFWSAPWSG